MCQPLTTFLVLDILNKHAFVGKFKYDVKHFNLSYPVIYGQDEYV